MDKHFCTCPVKTCDLHPANHESGCDLCIKKNLKKGEIPACFWVSIGGDLSNEKEFTVECFVDYFQRNREQYQLKQKTNETSKIYMQIANTDDIPAILQHEHLSESVLKNKVNRNEIYVACDGDIFIGWLRYNLFWDTIPFMNMLFLLPNYRGKSIGRQLVQYWEKQMKTQGYKKLMTSTQQNEHAQHFYVALGYVATGGFVQTSEALTEESLEIIFIKELDG